jgi:chromosome segregation ATPase
MSMNPLEEQILKVFRLTEEQLQSVRQAAAWAREVEARLGEEQKRSSQLEEQLQAFREAAGQAAARVRDLEAQLVEEQKRSSQLEEQLQAFREAAGQAAARVRDLEGQVAEEEKRSAQLVVRVAELEHPAACAEKLAQVLAEIICLPTKQGEASPRTERPT